MLKDRKYKRIHCKDGFSVSIQAGENKYSTPRQNIAGKYSAVALGYPSHKDDLIMSWAEDPDIPTKTVYGYVPSNTVYLLLTKHGGVVEGECPCGIPVYGEDCANR